MARESLLTPRTMIGMLGIVILAIFTHSPAAKDQKLKPEELVAKHLESIGTAEARAAAKNRVENGTGQVIFRLPSSGQLTGAGSIVSEGKMMRLSLVFNANDYPSEQVAFDGNKIIASQIRPGVRGNLAQFAYQHDVLLKEGLLGGAMSTAWCLLDVAGRQAKLDYGGTKKIEGRQLHELRYRPRKGAYDLQVSLYFDPETWRHVRSEYRMVQPPGMASNPGESSSRHDTLYHLDEVFEDFVTVDSLTLPKTWKLRYSGEGMGTTILCEYSIAVKQIAHNQALDAKAFLLQ